MGTHIQIGKAGEAFAKRWLMRRGWQILDTNWHCEYGEVDIVATRGPDLIFVEVKTRRSVAFGHPIEAISAAKLQRMRFVAGAWLRAHPQHRGRARLDVIGLLLRDGYFTAEYVEGVG